MIEDRERFQYEHIVYQVVNEAKETGRTIDDILQEVRTEAITHYELYFAPPGSYVTRFGTSRTAWTEDPQNTGSKPEEDQ